MNRRLFLPAAGLTGAAAITSQAPLLRLVSGRQEYTLTWFERTMVPSTRWLNAQYGEMVPDWLLCSNKVWLYPHELKDACARQFDGFLFEMEPGADDRVIWGVQLNIGTAADDYRVVE